MVEPVMNDILDDVKSPLDWIGRSNEDKLKTDSVYTIINNDEIKNKNLPTNSYDFSKSN